MASFADFTQALTEILLSAEPQDFQRAIVSIVEAASMARDLDMITPKEYQHIYSTATAKIDSYLIRWAGDNHLPTNLPS